MGTKAVEKGEFPFAAAFLEHGHIYGQCQGLIEAGAQLKWVYDPDAKKVEAFLRKFPDAKPARCYEEILEDSSVRLVAAAAVPSERCALGIQAMEAGKVRAYVTDFANPAVVKMERAIVIPHLGASTAEAEDNCAKMAVEEVMAYLERGEKIHCVNM